MILLAFNLLIRIVNLKGLYHFSRSPCHSEGGKKKDTKLFLVLHIIIFPNQLLSLFFCHAGMGVVSPEFIHVTGHFATCTIEGWLVSEVAVSEIWLDLVNIKGEN